MNPQIPNGNSTAILILSSLLIVSIIFLAVLFFVYLRTKRNLTEQLKNAKKGLGQTESNFGIFMTNLSREIRTHMIGIMGNDEIILRESSDGSVRTHASVIKSSSEDVISLTQGVMDFMRISSGNIDTVKKEYDLASLIVDVFTSVSPNFKNKEIALNATADKDCPRNLNGDPYKIKVTLLNLFSFISKNVDSKGIVDANLSFKNLKESSCDIRFTITCKGLTTENKKIESCILLSPSENKYNFSQSDHGFLELFLSGAILSFMKSKLYFEENEEGLKVFSFDIPVEVRDKETIGEIRDNSTVKNLRNYGKAQKINVFAARILMIDDTAENTSYFRKILVSVGASFVSADNSEDALSYIRKEEFDMFLLREGIKDSKDCEIIKRIRGGQVNPLNAHKPCIALCYDSSPDKSSDVYMKYDYFISLPSAPSEIEDVLIKYLPKNKYQLTDDLGVYPQIHGIEDIRRYSEGYEDLYRNALSIYKRASNYRKTDNK